MEIIKIEINNVPDNIMYKIDFEENEIYLKICGKIYNFEQ